MLLISSHEFIYPFLLKILGSDGSDEPDVQQREGDMCCIIGCRLGESWKRDIRFGIEFLSNEEM
jgi:hypothetical protein